MQASISPTLLLLKANSEACKPHFTNYVHPANFSSESRAKFLMRICSPPCKIVKSLFTFYSSSNNTCQCSLWSILWQFLRLQKKVWIWREPYVCLENSPIGTSSHIFTLDFKYVNLRKKIVSKNIFIVTFLIWWPIGASPPSTLSSIPTHRDTYLV